VTSSGKLSYRDVTANPTISADTFAVPEAIQACQASGNSNVPDQWVMRRLFLTSSTTVTMSFPQRRRPQLVELAPTYNMSKRNS